MSARASGGRRLWQWLWRRTEPAGAAGEEKALPPLTREEQLDIPPETAAEIDDPDEKTGDVALGEAGWLRSSD